MNDHQSSIVSALKDLSRTAERNFNFNAAAVCHHADDREVKRIGGRGEVGTKHLDAYHSQLDPHRRFWAEEFTLPAHPHQPAGFAAPAVGGKAGRSWRVEFLKPVFGLPRERVPEILSGPANLFRCD